MGYKYRKGVDRKISDYIEFDDYNVVHYKKELSDDVKEDLKTMMTYMQQVPDGKYMTYPYIEWKTGIKMDQCGKAVLRMALRNLNREWLCYRGHGIELNSEENAAEISLRRYRRDQNANFAAVRSYDITKPYVDRSGQPMKITSHWRQQQAVNTAGSILAAVSEYKTSYDSTRDDDDEEWRWGMGGNVDL